MEIVQLNDQHFIRMSDVRSVFTCSKEQFMNYINRYQWSKKHLEHEKVKEITFVSCKSIHHFLSWYLDNYSNPTVNDFRHGLTKYTKKIPKRALSRSMRVEIAYRQEYKCRRCNLFPIPPNFEIDHIIELQDGGKDVVSNLQALCPACHKEKTRLNRLRKNKIFREDVLEEYEKYIQPPAPKRAPLEARPSMIPMPERVILPGHNPKTIVMESNDELDEPTEQVFSKYFRKRPRCK